VIPADVPVVQESFQEAPAQPTPDSIMNDEIAKSQNKSFTEAIGERESSGDYGAVNQLGYLGKYQFGGSALTDLGYKKNGKWTGKDGINSKTDFLARQDVQDNAMKDYVEKQRGYLKDKGTMDYIGTTFKGIKITERGLIAASHLVGAGAVNKMLKTGVVPEDANGTKAIEYLKLGNEYSQ
jgi:hypothetical protein